MYREWSVVETTKVESADSVFIIVNGQFVDMSLCGGFDGTIRIWENIRHKQKSELHTQMGDAMWLMNVYDMCIEMIDTNDPDVKDIASDILGYVLGYLAKDFTLDQLCKGIYSIALEYSTNNYSMRFLYDCIVNIIRMEDTFKTIEQAYWLTLSMKICRQEIYYIESGLKDFIREEAACDM